MDWRKRDYYLIRTDPTAYQMRHELYKSAAPSIKYHAPYNHFKGDSIFDTCNLMSLGFKNPWVQEMISCKHLDSESLEFELRKANRRDSTSHFIKLTKEITKQ